jgi:hypothetical protein
LTIFLFRRIKQYSFASLFKQVLIYTLISLVAALYGWLMLQLLGHFSAIVQLGVGGVSSVLVYLALLYAVDREIAISILEMTGISKIYTAIRARISPAHETSPLG